MAIRDILLPEFDHEVENTRKLLACIPDATLTYKPHDKSMSLDRLAGHIAELPQWAVMTVDQDELELKPGEYKPYLPTSAKEVLERFDECCKLGRAAIARVSDEELQKPWTLKSNGSVVFTLTKYQVLRGIVMNHLVHHRAQLGVYLRLNNVAIPGMYGPSQDEMSAWAAQSA